MSKFYKDAKNGRYLRYLHEDTRTLYETFRRGVRESSEYNHDISFTDLNSKFIWSYHSTSPIRMQFLHYSQKKLDNYEQIYFKCNEVGVPQGTILGPPHFLPHFRSLTINTIIPVYYKTLLTGPTGLQDTVSYAQFKPLVGSRLFLSESFYGALLGNKTSLICPGIFLSFAPTSVKIK